METESNANDVNQILGFAGTALALGVTWFALSSHLDKNHIPFVSRSTSGIVEKEEGFKQGSRFKSDSYSFIINTKDGLRKVFVMGRNSGSIDDAVSLGDSVDVTVNFAHSELGLTTHYVGAVRVKGKTFAIPYFAP